MITCGQIYDLFLLWTASHIGSSLTLITHEQEVLFLQ